jgi:hypothetical protein
MDTEVRANASTNGTSASDSASTLRSNAMYGIGGEFNASKRFGIRIEWNRYAEVGSAEVTGDGDIDLLSAGFRISFH